MVLVWFSDDSGASFRKGAALPGSCEAGLTELADGRLLILGSVFRDSNKLSLRASVSRLLTTVGALHDVVSTFAVDPPWSPSAGVAVEQATVAIKMCLH